MHELLQSSLEIVNAHFHRRRSFDARTLFLIEAISSTLTRLLILGKISCGLSFTVLSLRKHIFVRVHLVLYALRVRVAQAVVIRNGLKHV